MIARSHQLTKAVVNLDKERKALAETEAKQRLEISKKRVGLAKGVMDDNFRLLANHSLVAVWSGLESTMNQFSETLINANPKVLQCGEFKKIKVPIAEYEQLADEDKPRFALGCLQRHIGSQHKPGVSKFEAILKCLNISGSVPQNVKDSIYEMSQVRNLIVHNRSIIDLKFLKKLSRGYKKSW